MPSDSSLVIHDYVVRINKCYRVFVSCRYRSAHSPQISFIAGSFFQDRLFLCLAEMLLDAPN